MCIGTKNHPHLNLLVVSWPFASSSSSANKTTRPSVSSTAKTSAPFGQNRRTKANNSVCFGLLAVCVECWARLFYSGLVVEPIFYCEPYRTLLRAGSPGRLICWFLARTQILVDRRVYLNVSIVVGGTWTITIIITLWCGWLFCVGSCILIVYYYHPFTVNFRIGMWKWKGVLSAQKAPPSFTWRRLLMGSS